MRYDFTKLQRAIDKEGMTLRDVQDMTGIHYSTMSKAFSSGRAHPRTALRLSKLFNLELHPIRERRGSKKAARSAA